MDINLLANKVLSHHVTRDNSASVQVNYKHIDPDYTENNIKCYVQSTEKEDTNTTHIKNSTEFHGLILEDLPAKNDIIEYDGIEWNVEKILSDIPGIFDVLAYENKHNMGRR